MVPRHSPHCKPRSQRKKRLELLLNGVGSPFPMKMMKSRRRNDMRLANEIGIVTAAASGMGRAGALRFAREGAAVGVVDIDRAGADAVVREITAAGGRALAIAGD